MDECLAGLEQWREQRVREREAPTKVHMSQGFCCRGLVSVTMPSYLHTNIYIYILY